VKVKVLIVYSLSATPRSTSSYQKDGDGDSGSCWTCIRGARISTAKRGIVRRTVVTVEWDRHLRLGPVIVDEIRRRHGSFRIVSFLAPVILAHVLVLGGLSFGLL